MEINETAFEIAVEAAEYIHNNPASNGWNRKHYRNVYRAAIEAYLMAINAEAPQPQQEK